MSPPTSPPPGLLFAGTLSLSSSSVDDGIAPSLLLLEAVGSAWLSDSEDEGDRALFMSWGGSRVGHLDCEMEFVRHSASLAWSEEGSSKKGKVW